MRKLYVGNLSYGTVEETLQQLFAQFGHVESVNIIRDRETQQSKGFGFVQFEDDASAQKAIAALDAKEVDGRKIRVSEAQERPRQPRPERPSYRPASRQRDY